MCFVICHVFLTLFVTTPILKVKNPLSQNPPTAPLRPHLHQSLQSSELGR